jgi:hypothetical protein
VRLVEVVGQAHVAGATVEVVLPTTNPADAAASAVKLLFVFIIVELAVEAEVLRVQYHDELLNLIISQNKQKARLQK